jgi:hypothetical protein
MKSTITIILLLLLLSTTNNNDAAKIGDPVDMSQVGIKFDGTEEEQAASMEALKEQIRGANGGNDPPLRDDGEIDVSKMMDSLQMGGEDGGDGAGGMEGMEAMMKGMGGMDGGMMGGGNPEKRFFRDIPIIEEDIPLVQCEACKILVKKINNRYKELKQTLKKTKIGESNVLDLLEHACDPQHEDGEWLTEYDVVEENDRLKLVRQPAPGYCEEECKTIAAACERVKGEVDADIAEKIYLGKGEDPEKVCIEVGSDLKGMCGQPYPKIPSSRTPGGDNFKVKSSYDLQMDKVNRDIRKMQDIKGGLQDFGGGRPDEL